MEQIKQLIEKYQKQVAELNKDLITFGYVEEKEAYAQTLGEKATLVLVVEDLKSILNLSIK